MSAYGITLFLHSWTRWALLIVAVLVIIQAWRGWSGQQLWDASKQKLAAGFVHLTSLQLVLGLLLYGVLSPVTLAAMADMGAAMKDSSLRFWAVEHITMMLIAVGLAHVGAGRIKKRPTTVASTARLPSSSPSRWSSCWHRFHGMNRHASSGASNHDDAG